MARRRSRTALADAGEQVVLDVARRRDRPTSDRARIQSSHGYTSASSSSVEPEPERLVRVDLGGVGQQRSGAGPQVVARRRCGS